MTVEKLLPGIRCPEDLRRLPRQALPQVAAERHWSSETFLRQTCVKAGLPADAWRCGAAVFSFEALVFSESPIS